MHPLKLSLEKCTNAQHFKGSLKLERGLEAADSFSREDARICPGTEALEKRVAVCVAKGLDPWSWAGVVRCR